MRIFISGGCKNGKSSHAQRLAKGQRAPGRPLYYLATMTPKDAEDIDRIRRHQLEREGLGFETVESFGSLSSVFDKIDPNGSILLDSVTALLSDAMFAEDGTVDMEAHIRLERELRCFVGASANIVLVSDGIYSEARRFDPLTEAYRQRLAFLDHALANACDVVLEAAYGTLIAWKGDLREVWRHADA